MTRPQPLSRTRVIDAALALVDEEGLDALTMRAVARRLGVEAMSLYHHVANKDGMVDGVADRLLAEAGLPTDDVRPAEWIAGVAEALRRIGEQHPHAFGLLRTRPLPLLDEAVAQPFEAGLRAFMTGGRTLREAHAAVQIVLWTISTLVALAQEQVAAGGADEPTSQVASLDPARFPLLTILPGEAATFDDLWDTALQVLVEGLTS